MSGDGQYHFAGYRLDLPQRQLFRGAEPVPLTPRAFDLLAVLVRNAGRVVSKEEVLKEVWGQSIVEDGTITWHLHSLRQALAQGDSSARFIETVPKRGYRFVATVGDAAGEAEVEPRPPAPATPAPARKRRWWWLAGAAAVGLALAGAWLLTREPHLPYAKRDWLLVAAFENQTGEPRFDRALHTALTVSLEQSTFVNVYPRGRVATVLERMRRPAEATLDETLAREICRREGLRALVMPAITRTGTRYAVAARLIDPESGNTVRAYLFTANDESQVLRALQDLATRLRGDLGESIAEIAASNQPLEQVTTPVLAALQQYSEGIELWARARSDEAVQRFEAALTADPEFAMAHAAMGKARYSAAFNRPDLGSEYFQRALALSSRTTERERQLIAAEFAASRGQVAEARRLYAVYAAAYPDDLRMHQRMGDLLLNAAMFEPARDAFTAALALDPVDVRLLFNRGVALAGGGDFAAALRAMQAALQLDPEFAERGPAGVTYGFTLFGAGDRQGALDYFAAMRADRLRAFRAERALGLIDLYEGRYESARAHFRAAISSGSDASDANLTRSRNHGYLAAVAATQGNRAEARRELDRAVAALDAHGPAPIEFRARLVMAYARLGLLPVATQQLQILTTNADPLRPRDRAILQMVRAEMDLAGGQPTAAMEKFRAALQGEPGIELPLALDGLARASEYAGDVETAIDSYRQLIGMRGRVLAWEAQESWMLAHLRLARLLQARGDAAGAAAALEVIRQAWREADPDLPAVRELRALNPEASAITTFEKTG